MGYQNINKRLEQVKERDKTKTAQLVLYKKFFSEQYGYPLDRIQVRYFIVKRKLWEEAMFHKRGYKSLYHLTVNLLK